jgi:plastocyanin
MRFRMRWPGLVTVVGVAAVLLALSSSGEVAADGRHVTIQDNKAPSPKDGFDPRQGRWQFNPNNVEVKRGEPVVFTNPPGNDHPHTVTNLRRTSPPLTVPATFVGGDLFDSGNIESGQSFTLNTANLAQGHYPFVCRLHPWMTGEVTVVE